MKPNLFIIGAQKAGTTFLGRKLNEHPDIFLVEPEIHYFNKTENLNKGTGWYENWFAGAGHAKYIGEKTPNYLWTNIPPQGTDLRGCAERLYRYAPDARLIVLLRDPVKRALSAFNHHFRQGRFSPFRTADDYLTGKLQHEAEKYGVLSMGMYYTQLMEYRQYFSREQLLILFYEDDVRLDPVTGLRKCLLFLQLDPTFTFSNTSESINAGRNAALTNYLHFFFPPSKRVTHLLNRVLPPADDKKPSIECIHKLQKFYEPENQRLFDWLQRPNLWN